jgi:hypothetical protein
MTTRFLNYPAGSGIRVYSRFLMSKLGYRPADEDRRRACDTSILTNLRQVYPELRIEHREIDPRQIVDWKSPSENLNPYEAISHRYREESSCDPFVELADVFPAEALEEMAGHYSLQLVPA